MSFLQTDFSLVFFGMLGEFMGYFLVVLVNVFDFSLLKAATSLTNALYNVIKNPPNIHKFNNLDSQEGVSIYNYFLQTKFFN